MKKRVLIITANFFPMLGPRPHRSTELAKELSKRGYNVTVYTLTGAFDYTAFESQYGIKVKNLGRSNKGLLHNDGYVNLSLLNRIKIKLFKKYLLYPFNTLISLTYRALKQENFNYDHLITVAHPHTIHWGAATYFSKHIKKVKWIADCGDPFMNDPFNKYPKYLTYFEHKWCKLVDFITIPIEDGKSGYYPEYWDKIRIIPQGFSMDNVITAVYSKNNVPTFAYSGVFYRGLRDPSSFLEYLSTLNIDFKFIIYTKSKSVVEPFTKVLGSKLEIRDYVPRNELIYELSKVDFLINILNESSVQQPSKLIDYYLTTRPILEIETKFKEEKVFNEFLNGNYSNQKSCGGINQYNIINVVNKFEEIL